MLVVRSSCVMHLNPWNSGKIADNAAARSIQNNAQHFFENLVKHCGNHVNIFDGYVDLEQSFKMGCFSRRKIQLPRTSLLELRNFWSSRTSTKQRCTKLAATQESLRERLRRKGGERNSGLSAETRARWLRRRMNERKKWFRIFYVSEISGSFKNISSSIFQISIF